MMERSDFSELIKAAANVAPEVPAAGDSPAPLAANASEIPAAAGEHLDPLAANASEVPAAAGDSPDPLAAGQPSSVDALAAFERRVMLAVAQRAIERARRRASFSLVASLSGISVAAAACVAAVIVWFPTQILLSVDVNTIVDTILARIHALL